MTQLFNLPTLFDPHAVSRMFEELDRDVFNVRSSYPYNIVQKEGAVVLEYALAGFAKEDIKVYVEEDELKIEASEEVDEEKEEPNYLHQGIAKRDLKVSFKLGTTVDIGKIKSSFVDGLLTVEVPLKEKEVVDIKVD